MRKLKRIVARYKMTKKGFTKLNHKHIDTRGSYFAKHWREYV